MALSECGSAGGLEYGASPIAAPRGQGDGAERHLCVVVQSDVFNRSRTATTVVCPITSDVSLSYSPGHVALSKRAANLPRASVVNVSQVLTINKTELVERIGRLPAGAIDAIPDHFLFERH
jgi:mRNA interferase MazF